MESKKESKKDIDVMPFMNNEDGIRTALVCGAISPEEVCKQNEEMKRKCSETIKEIGEAAKEVYMDLEKQNHLDSLKKQVEAYDEEELKAVANKIGEMRPDILLSALSVKLESLTRFQQSALNLIKNM